MLPAKRGVEVQVEVGVRVQAERCRPRLDARSSSESRPVPLTSFRPRLRPPESCGVCGVLFVTLNWRKPSVAVADVGQLRREAHRGRVGAVHVEAVLLAQAEAERRVEAGVEARRCR